MQNDGTMQQYRDSQNDAATAGDSEESEESFYLSSLPYHIIFEFVLSILLYNWHIWLERILPTRPRSSVAAYEQTKVGEGNEDREEGTAGRCMHSHHNGN